METHTISHATSRMKADDTVNTALDSKLQWESNWSRKFSITNYSETQFNLAIEQSESQQPQPKSILNSVK